MQIHLWFALFGVIAAPLVSASYGNQQQQPQYQSGADAGYGSGAAGTGAGAVQLGTQPVGPELSATADVQPTGADAQRLSRVNAQLQALNANPGYQKLKNSEDIAESLDEANLASNIRQGKINVVSPQYVDQHLFRALLVPSNNNHQVIATQPLPPVVVYQPGSPVAHVNSGPATVVRGNPVIYKIKPSVIYQQEVINKVPTPLSLNPVYVKVYKPGKKIDTPLSPIVAPTYAPQQPTYVNVPAPVAPAAYDNQQSSSSAAAASYDSLAASSNDGYAAAAGADAPLYASPAPYATNSGY